MVQDSVHIWLNCNFVDEITTYEHGISKLARCFDICKLFFFDDHLVADNYVF